MRFPCTGEKKNSWRPRLRGSHGRDREDEAACAAFAAIDEITLRLATNNLAEILFYGTLSPLSGIRMSVWRRIRISAAHVHKKVYA